MQKLERANQIHWNLVEAKATYLNKLGFEIDDNQLIDLFSENDDDRVIYEMKSINKTAENTVSQVRKAVSQLYEYRYVYNYQNARLCIVTNSELSGQYKWISDYLSKDRSIAYEWTEDFKTFSCSKESAVIMGRFYC